MSREDRTGILELPSVSVVIPTKNAGDLFGETMRAVRRQEYAGKFEIVVVDSGSTDKTLAVAHDYGATVLKIPPEAFNHGTARDHGISNSLGEVIVLMTQDAVPTTRYLVSQFVGAFDDPRVVGAYCRQIPRGDADLLTARNLNRWLTGRTCEEKTVISDVDNYMALSPMERYLRCNFDNVCSAIRRSMWERQPFGKHDFGEDLAWAKRVLEGGWAIRYCGHIAVVHSHQRSAWYEYRRTYVCHRKLFELFGLATIPTRSLLWQCWINSMMADARYVISANANLSDKFPLFLKIPLLSWASVYGQYCGARDARLSVVRKQSGV